MWEKIRTNSKTYTGYLIYLAAVTLLAGLVVGLIRGRFDLSTQILLGVGILSIALYALLQPEQVRRFFTGRSARYGSSALVMSIAFLGILGLLNYLSARYHRRFDLTQEKEFSLAPQSVRIIKELDEPVRVTGFFTAGYYAGQEVEDLLTEYSYHTDRFSFEIIDPELKPGLAREYGIVRDGTLIYQQADRQEVDYGTQEQDITSAILKVTSAEQKGIYFLTGHREGDPNGSDRTGYGFIKEALEHDNFVVNTFNLAVTDTIPSDMTVLVIAAPQVEILADEAERLSTYWDGGGSLLVMTEPSLPDPLGGLLAKWGVQFRDDIVIDPMSSFFGDVASPLVTRFGLHQITADLVGLTTFFPSVRSINYAQPEGTDVMITPLVLTSDASWGETNLEELRVRLDAGEDNPGPLEIAVVIERDLALGGEGAKHKARMVIFGDSDFATDGVLGSVQGSIGNADLFLNAVSWLAEEEELISIRPEPPRERTITVTGPEIRLVLYTCAILLPLTVLIVGGVIWWRRR